MKESVEKHKDEVRNMTMILSSPDALTNLSVHHTNEPPSPGLGTNILDELNEDDNGEGKGGSLGNMNNSLFNGTSMLNMSSNKGLNTTMNFIKSSCTLTKCKEK
jgi:hypothetical protein